MRVLALVAALAFAGTAQAAEPYDINVILSLNGGGAFVGRGEQDNLRVLEAKVNAEGGIAGRPLRFVFHDDETSAQLAVQLASAIVAGQPAVMLGPSLIAMCKAVAPLMPAGPVLYCLSPGLRPAPGSLAFSASASPSDQFRALVRFSRLKGWTRMAILTATDATGQDADNGIKEALGLPENAGMQLVAHEHFNLGDVSVTAQLERIKSRNPQVLVSWVTGAAIAAVFKGAIQAGLDIPIGVSAGNQSFAQLARYANFLPKLLLLPSPLFPEHDGVLTFDPRVEKVQHEMYAALKAQGVKPDNMTADSWDVGLIVVDALRKLGPDATAQQLRDHIAGLQDFPGVSGLYDFKSYPERGLGPDSTAVVTYDAQNERWVWLSGPGGNLLKQ